MSYYSCTLGLCFLMGASTPLFADTAELPLPFHATCVAVGVHAYRYNESTTGKVTTNEWTTSESFGGPWKFEYQSSGTLLIDGEKATIIDAKPNQLLAMTGGFSNEAASIWTYAIHTGLRRVVASQVNSFNGVFGPGVKARSVEFGCDFLTKDPK